MISIPVEEHVCNQCKELKQSGTYFYNDQNTSNLIQHCVICDDCFEELNPDMENVQKLLNKIL